tara:strand:+ start:5255 stop:5800 length:546 start_codon:yes stop_codon:yes gene_type:complete
MIYYEEQIATKTLKILNNRSWNSLSLEEIKKNNKNKKIHLNSKFQLFKIINKYVDNKLINEMKFLEISSSKDMLFEVFMARFDILQKNRNAFIEIYKYFKKNPQNFIKLLPNFLESMIITAELSKYNVNGLKGTIRLKGLMIIYFVTFFSWIEDKTSSLEKTMTELDKNLDRAEKFAKIIK